MKRCGIVVLIVVVSIALTASASSSLAATIHVPGDAPTIGAAIGLALTGDTILVAPGTYLESGLDFGGKDLVLDSVDGPDVTIIDGHSNGNVLLFQSGETADALVDGFTITGGMAVEGGGVLIKDSSPVFRDCVFEHNTAALIGGGAAVNVTGFNSFSSPVFERCRFTNNDGDGLGVRNIFSHDDLVYTISGCTFENNTGNGLSVTGGDDTSMVTDSVFRNNDGHGLAFDGGPPFPGSGTFVDCEFSSNGLGGIVSAGIAGPEFIRCQILDHNTAEKGAGIRDDQEEGRMRFTECLIARNESADRGGGAYSSNAGVGRTRFIRCTFEENTAVRGGGVYFEENPGSLPVVEECLFIHNTAHEDGGAIAQRGLGTITQVLDSTFWKNVAGARGGGVAAILGEFADLEIRRSTFAENQAPVGGGVFFESSNFSPSDLDISETIIAFSSDGAAVACDLDGGEAIDVACSDFFGNSDGDWVDCVAGLNGVAGNISLDPEFCNLPLGVLRLAETSPCAPAHSGDCGLIGAQPVGCGVTTLDAVDAPAVARHLSVAPNPVFHRATFSIEAGGGPAVLEIYGPGGRLVERLEARERIEWIPGELVPLGVYFARLRGPAVDESVKFTVLR